MVDSEVLCLIDDVAGLHFPCGFVNPYIGRMDAEMPVQQEGKDLLIGFNPPYLMDALQNIEEEEVDLYFTISRSPVFIRDQEESYNYMILPVNFNAEAVG